MGNACASPSPAQVEDRLNKMLPARFDLRGITPLIWAAVEGDEDTVAALLERETIDLDELESLAAGKALGTPPAALPKSTPRVARAAREGEGRATKPTPRFRIIRRRAKGRKGESAREQGVPKPAARPPLQADLGDEDMQP